MKYQRPNPKQLQAACDRFNSEIKVGQDVIVELDGGAEKATRTTSEAQVLSGHTAVVWLDGVSGCYIIERVRATTATKGEN
jgi:hypothetical protein